MINLKSLCLVLLCFFVSLHVRAEEAVANRWLADKSDILNMKLGILNPGLSWNVRDSQNKATTSVDYLAPSYNKGFLGVSYRNLGASISWSFPQKSESLEKYGAGSALDLQFNIYGIKLSQHYVYQRYNAYYIHNTAELYPSYRPNSFIKRPDMSTQNIGANWVYSFQPENYSRKAGFDQSGRQVQSGGSWLAMVALHNHKFSSNPQLLPAVVQSKFGELASLQSGDIVQLSLSGGGGYSWVFWENWFFNVEALFGLGYAYQKFETDLYYYNRTASSVAGNGTMALGYNGKSDYFVIMAGNDSFTYNLTDLTMQVTTTNASIAYGHRFDGVGIPMLDKVSGWFD